MLKNESCSKSQWNLIITPARSLYRPMFAVGGRGIAKIKIWTLIVTVMVRASAY